MPEFFYDFINGAENHAGFNQFCNVSRLSGNTKGLIMQFFKSVIREEVKKCVPDIKVELNTWLLEILNH